MREECQAEEIQLEGRPFGMKAAACAFREGAMSGLRASTSFIETRSFCVPVSSVGASYSSKATLPKKSQMTNTRKRENLH